MGSLILKQVTVGDTPSNGAISLYTKSDNALYSKDANGNESTFLVSDANRNRIINGDMKIAQRATSFAAIANGAYSIDRFLYGKTGPVHTLTQDTASVPTTTQAGRFYKYSLKAAVTTLSVATTDFAVISQYIEGYNIADIIGNGYNSGFTLSFWVRDTITGIHCVSFRNSGGDRSYVAEYTINNSNTWEYKTITVTAAPSGGTWDNVNGIGLRVDFVIMAGSTSGGITTANAWQSNNFIATANQVNGCSSTSNIFQLTGVQLEAGTRATNFEYRNFQTELALCQRYYTKSYDYATALNTNTQTGRVAALSGNTNTAEVFTTFPVKMRGAPTIQIISQTGTNSKITVWASGADIGTTVTAAIATKGESKIEYITDAGNGLTTANLYTFHYTASAEL